MKTYQEFKGINKGDGSLYLPNVVHDGTLKKY